MLQSVRECCRVLQSVTECNRVLQSFTECYRVLQSVTEFYRVLQSITNLAHLPGPIFGLVLTNVKKFSHIRAITVLVSHSLSRSVPVRCLFVNMNNVFSDR